MRNLRVPLHNHILLHSFKAAGTPAMLRVIVCRV
jgi:hypothetical protein